jgi:hypothetical protein
LSLQPLPPDLTPEQVEKLRWDAFGHKRALSLKSADDLVRYTHRRGFVLLRPHAGIHFPSVLEATVGRPLLEFTWDERTAHLERWSLDAMAARRVVQAAVLDGRAALLSPAFLPDFYALSTLQGDLHDGERLLARGAITADAAALCAALRDGGPLAAPALRDAARVAGENRQARWSGALDEALRRLLVVQVGGEPSDGGPAVPIYDLLPRAFPDEVEKSRGTVPEAARSRIACRYLRNVLVEASHEMARVLGWQAEDTLAALRALVVKHMASVHPASRPQRHLFQASATDVLQEEAPRRRRSGGV